MAVVSSTPIRRIRLKTPVRGLTCWKSGRFCWFLSHPYWRLAAPLAILNRVAPFCLR